MGQQFDIARHILDAGLVPIIEPEVDIHSPQKSEAEAMLTAALLGGLDRLDERPAGDDQADAARGRRPLRALVAHPKVLRVVALSGGYPRDEANALLARQHGVVASFSRALTEGLSVDQSDREFDATLDASIAGIYAASIT